MATTFEINKKGINFIFSQGHLNAQDKLVYAWQAPNIIENPHDPEGLFYHAEYDPERNAIIMPERFDFQGVMAKGVGLEAATRQRVERYYQSLLKKRLKDMEKLVDAVVRGKTPVSFCLVGSNTAHFQPSLSGLEKHALLERETDILDAAIRLAYIRAGAEAVFLDPVEFLEDQLKQGITTAEFMHPKAFNLIFDPEIQAFYGYEKEIVTGFEIKLVDILSEDILRAKEKMEAIRQRAGAIAFKQCRECGHFFIVGKYDASGKNVLHLPMGEWQSAQAAFQQARTHQLEDALNGMEQDLSIYMEKEGFKMAVVGLYYCGC